MHIDLTAGVDMAEIDLAAPEDEPVLAEPRRRICEVQAHGEAGRQAFDGADIAAHVPHQKAHIDRLEGGFLVDPLLPPDRHRPHHGPERASGFGQMIGPDRAADAGRMVDDPGCLEVPRSPREERARHQRHSPRDLVEPARAVEKLPDHQQRPSVAQGFARDRERAVLAVARHHRSSRPARRLSRAPARECRRRPARLPRHRRALPDEATCWFVLRKAPPLPFRGGSVCLNRFRAFSKWIAASVMPLPPQASAGRSRPDRAFSRQATNVGVGCFRSRDGG
jgi:hypothetical protein